MTSRRRTAPLTPTTLASWVEHRLHECPVVGAGARLYGVEVLDAAVLHDPDAQAARLTFVDESPDPSRLVLGPGCAAAIAQFDAVVLAATRWEPTVQPLPRPGANPKRRRVRVVTVVGDAGAASAWRFDHDPDRAEVRAGLALAGAAGVQLAAMWAGRRQ